MTEPTKPSEPTGPAVPAAGETAAWGAPAPAGEPKKAWSGRKTAIAAGVAVVIAAGGGAAIWAGTAANGSEQGQNGMMGGPGGTRILGGPGTMIQRDALHGDFVVSDGNGFSTERMQTGEITEISATSVSLTSKDGYKQVYTIDSSTQKTGDPKVGETVTVTAKVTGDTATATTLGKANQQQRGQNGGRPGQGGQGGPPGQGTRPGY